MRPKAQPIALTTSLSALLLSMAILTPTPARADTACADVVAATVAEQKAGAAEWNPTIESLVRSAAGAACVKAQTGAYASPAAASPAAAPAAVEETPAQKADESPVLEEQLVAASDTTIEDADEDDGKAGWKFLGFEVNTVTGSPAEKPYERKR